METLVEIVSESWPRSFPIYSKDLKVRFDNPMQDSQIIEVTLSSWLPWWFHKLHVQDYIDLGTAMSKVIVDSK